MKSYKLVSIVGIILLIGLYFSSCKRKKETIQPIKESITHSVYASGIVKSRNQYQVFPKLAGVMGKLLVSEGDEVKQGQIIAELDNSTALLARDNAALTARFNDVKNNQDKLIELKYNVDLARQKMKNDSVMYGRQIRLWQQEIGSKVELEQKELLFQNSKTAYENALLRYSQLKKQLAYSADLSKINYEMSSSQNQDLFIRSEETGRVYTLLKKQGEMVSPQTSVAIIGKSNEFYLELQVDEFDIANVKIGQKAVVSMDSYKGDVFEAEIIKIYPIMNERSKTFTVEARFITQPQTLYPNLTIESNIVIETKKNALLIPRNYVIEDKFVILENGDKKEVTIGLKDYQKAEILKGVTEKDVLVKP